MFIDVKKQKVWFNGKEIAEILGYKDTKSAISDNVSKEDKKLLLKLKGRLAAIQTILIATSLRRPNRARPSP